MIGMVKAAGRGAGRTRGRGAAAAVEAGLLLLLLLHLLLLLLLLLLFLFCVWVCGHDFCYFRHIYPFEDVDVTSTPTNIFLLKVVSIDTESSGVPAGQGGGLMWQCICKITE